eukprot:2798_1
MANILLEDKYLWNHSRCSKYVKEAITKQNDSGSRINTYTGYNNDFVKIDAIPTSHIQKFMNQSNVLSVSLYIRFQLIYSDQNLYKETKLTDIQTIPLKIQKIVLTHRSSQHIEYKFLSYDLTRRNIALILQHFIRNFLNTNGLTDITKMIHQFIPAKDGTFKITCISAGHCLPYKLYSDYEYEFDSIYIGDDVQVSVEKYDPDTNIGGKLLMSSLTDICIRGEINMDGLGYCSYATNYKNKQDKNTNVFKGFGCGDNFGSGAGYGTMGNYSAKRNVNKKRNKSRIRHSTNASKYFKGNIYGDKMISFLYLGSAGGNVIKNKKICYGHPGGGAVYLKCPYGKFINHGRITAYGSGNEIDNIWRRMYSGGCGSGGSIKIECDEFEFQTRQLWGNGIVSINCYNYIGVCGGSNKKFKVVKDWMKGLNINTHGNGGIGRICIKVKDILYHGNDIVDRCGLLKMKSDKQGFLVYDDIKIQEVFSKLIDQGDK